MAALAALALLAATCSQQGAAAGVQLQGLWRSLVTGAIGTTFYLPTPAMARSSSACSERPT
jgi:hypothetical protein